MKFSNLTFIVTDNCNFNCSYCHQEKQENIISNHTTKRSAEFFYPFLNDTEQNYISFYGGEPLLAFEQITYAVGLINEMNKTGNKKINYTITTNGSLLTGENMDFFERNEFTVVLSFDGLAQEKGREEGTFEQMVLVMKELQARPGIKVEINSVFSPQTIRLLAASMQFIIQQKGPEITFNISTIEEWGAGDMEVLKKELEKLSEYLGIYYRGTGDIPVKNFRNSSPGDRPVVYRCSAGREQVTVSPDGDIWGCYLFHDYFKSRKDSRYYREFAFGGLDDFIGNHEQRYNQIMANYTQLRQDFFKVEEGQCFLCSELTECMVCPLNAAYSTGKIGRISCRHCTLKKIERNAVKTFSETIKK